jgi:hypothetical protein
LFEKKAQNIKNKFEKLDPYLNVKYGHPYMILPPFQTLGILGTKEPSEGRDKSAASANL